MRILVFAVAISVAWTNLAVGQANSLKRTVVDFGLIGVWAADCDQTASLTNNYITYATTADSNVTMTTDVGKGSQPPRFQITQAEQIADDRLVLRLIYLNLNQNMTVELVITNDRFRVWSSRVVDGKILVKDGVMLDKRETWWMNRCRTSG